MVAARGFTTELAGRNNDPAVNSLIMSSRGKTA